MFKVISLPNVVCLGDLITVTALLFVGTNFRDFYKIYTYFILSDDMKKTKQKQTKTKNVERHAGGLSKLKYI
jgi:IS1 family transposase